MTADGTLHELDLLVYATGFDARAYVRPLTVIGEARAHPGRGVGRRPDGLPVGRGAGIPQSVHADGPAFADRQPVTGTDRRGPGRLCDVVDQPASRWCGAYAAAPTEAATKEYNESMKAAMPQTIWVTGCSSWYLGKDGLPELFPWTPETHRELLRQPEPRRLRRAHRLRINGPLAWAGAVVELAAEPPLFSTRPRAVGDGRSGNDVRGVLETECAVVRDGE